MNNEAETYFLRMRQFMDFWWGSILPLAHEASIPKLWPYL